MKFGKEFKKQMVPEWSEAYMDYNGLKRILREILLFKKTSEQQQQQHSISTPPPPSRAASHTHSHRRLTLLHSPIHHHHHLKKPGDIEDQAAISVNTIINIQSREGGSSSSEDKIYKTSFLHQSDEGGENEATFFRKLDQELNKVNSFYKDKVLEAMDEAASLDKQMDALIALRFKVADHHPAAVSSDDGSSSPPPTMRRHSSSTDNFAPSPSGIAVPASRRAGTTRKKEHVDFIPGITNANHDNQQEEPTEPDPVQSTNGGCVSMEQVNKGIINDHKPDPLQILEHVKINNTLETPMSTIKGVIKDSRDEELCFRKEELKKVEQQLKLVFIEFYRKLRHLKYYSFTNLSAFAKIMKKYEKISARGASRAYMKIVDNSYIGSSDEVTGLLERVEATFIKHFSKSNRRAGMKSLRPKVKREKHSITFFSGFFSGCLIALVIAVILNIEDRNLMDKEEGTLYMANVFPLYSLYAYVVLHMLMYAANIYFWRRYRVNYPFIFGFKQGTELGYREVVLLSTGLGVLALASFLTFLHTDMNSRTHNYQKFTKLIPLGLVMVVLVITFCPFNIVYRSSRFFLINCIRRCIFAPLYKVTLPDFFLADNLTSQVQAIRSFTLYICYYGLGEFSRRQNKCHSHDVYNAFYFIVAVVPYWIRFLQCLRRLIEEKDAVHGYNGLKYFLTIVAVTIRTAFELKKGRTWMVLALVSSAVATIMNTYWDIVVDWGLLRRHSSNFCLRDKLVLTHKSVYFFAMVLNILLRLAWMQLVLEFNLHYMHKMAALIIVSCLEIIRRGIWNFFRLENEHLNNVGKYRAFKSVPLPFNYYDDDKDD